MAGTALGALPGARPRQASSQVKALLTAGVLAITVVAAWTAPVIERSMVSGEITGASSSASVISPALPNTLSAVRPLDGAGEGGQVPPRGQAGEMSANSPTPQYPDAIAAIAANSEPSLSALQVRERDLVAAVLEHFPREHWQTVFSVAWCESRYDTAAVGAAGERGSMQIQPRVWGAVPSDVWGQMRQAAAIVSVHGFAPWSCFR